MYLNLILDWPSGTTGCKLWEYIVCSMCYKMCIVPHDCNYVHWLYCVCSHYKSFVCLVMMVVKIDIISALLFCFIKKCTACVVLVNTALMCYIVYHLRILFLYLVHIFWLWNIVLYCGLTLFTFFCSFHMSPRHFWRIFWNNSL